MRAKEIVLPVALAALMLPMKQALADQTPQQNTDQLSKLSAEMSAWYNSIPISANPTLDTSGANCMVGQSGSVWFIPTQALASTPIIRTCSIPAGVSLFVSVFDFFADNTPGVCGQGRPLTVEQLRAQIKPFVDGATNLSLEVDGNPIRITRVQSDVFVLAQPADNLQTLACPPGQSPAGVFSPAVDDGYFVLLQPLSVGNHTLHITASDLPLFPFTADITYDLTVVPVTTK
jgi:hypothetical protein